MRRLMRSEDERREAYDPRAWTAHMTPEISTGHQQPTAASGRFCHFWSRNGKRQKAGQAAQEMLISRLVGESASQFIRKTAEEAPQGCLVEVGVYQGGTAEVLAEVARKQNRRLYLYDTFTGIPYQGGDDVHRVGDFSETSEEQVRALIPDAVICAGIFPDTLVKMPPVAFAHIDCDQYQSVKACCETLGPLMVPGGAMIFDDYNCLMGATRAVQECFGDRVQETPDRKAIVRF